MKSIIFGNTGFIGSHLYAALQAAGHEVLGISTTSQDVEMDLRYIDDGDLEWEINKFKPDYIFHFACYPNVKDYHNRHNHELNITHKILDATPENCKFIYASSIAVNGNNGYPCSVYGIHKAASEQLIKIYKNIYKRIKGYSILRFCSHVENSGVVKSIIKQAQSDAPQIELLGDYPGSNKPFISIKESIPCILKTLDLPDKIYNICPHDNIYTQLIAENILSELKITKPIIFLGEDENWPGDIKHLSVLNPDFSVINSQDCIINYIRENYIK